MMHRWHRAIFATPVAALGLGLALAAAPATQQQSGKGLTMTMTTTMTSPQMPAPEVFTIVKLQLSSSGKARADYLPDGSKPDATPPQTATGDRPPIMKAGTYSLSRKGGDTTYIIDPSQKKMWVMLKSDLVNAQAAAKAAGNMQYTDVDISSTRVTPDSTIEGLTVQHWRVIDNHAMKTGNFTMLAKMHYEIYTSPDYDIGAATAFDANAFATGGDTSYAKRLRTALAQAMHGLPMLMQMQMQMVDNKGKTTAMAMGMRASNISHTEPPASVFVMPTGYTMVRANFGATGSPPGSAAASPAGSAGASGARPSLAGGSTDTANKISTDSLVNKQAGTNVTNPTNGALQKVKSAIHFP
jgi:hypothetical protein